MQSRAGPSRPVLTPHLRGTRQRGRGGRVIRSKQSELSDAPRRAALTAEPSRRSLHPRFRTPRRRGRFAPPCGEATGRTGRRRSAAIARFAEGDPRREQQDCPFPAEQFPRDAVPRRRSRRDRRGLRSVDPLSVGRQRLLRGQGEPGAGNRRDAGERAARISTSRARPRSSLCLGNGATPGPALLRQHDQEGEGHRLRLRAGRAAVRVRQRGASWRSWRAQAPGARVFCRILVSCEGAEWPLSRKFGCAPGDGGRAAAQAPAISGSTPTASRSMSARSRPTWRNGTAPSARWRACSRCSPRPTSICAWSISAAASRRAIAARSPGSRLMRRR